MAKKKSAKKAPAKKGSASAKKKPAPKKPAPKKKPAAPQKKPAAPRAAPAAAPQVQVVNMIPRSLSRETNQDSEPSITVNSANPLQIVGTAFTPDPMGGALAPIYISTDGGDSWQLNSIVPSTSGSGTGTSDISLAFATSGGALYGGILRDPTTDFETLRTLTFAAPTAMDTVATRPDNDQPFAHAITNGSSDRVYIGNNDFQSTPNTATVDVSLDGRATSPSFTSARIESRSTAGQDGPQIRPVAHADGTVYAAFHGWRTQSGSFPGNTLIVTTDVVVVRDDHGGSGPTLFQDLVDPGDHNPGRLVARGVKTPFNQTGTPATGQQRLGGTLSLAVDPRPGQSGTVYLAWSDTQGQGTFTLHVRRSTDRGVTWSSIDLLSVPGGTNAALAINSNGKVGLLYQQLTGSGGSLRWVTHFRSSTDGQSWGDLVLANTPANVPAKTFDPYLGDYDHLVAVGTDFYGIFSAANTPDMNNFPSGVKYQRNANFSSHTLLAIDNTTQVAASIDPFFFKVSG
jgi:hypothetical protein